MLCPCLVGPRETEKAACPPSGQGPLARRRELVAFVALAHAHLCRSRLATPTTTSGNQHREDIDARELRRIDLCLLLPLSLHTMAKRSATSAAPAGSSAAAPTTTATTTRSAAASASRAAAASSSSSSSSSSSGNALQNVADNLLSHYQKSTPPRTKLLDAFMAFLVAVGALQFVYCVLAGNYVSRGRETGMRRRGKRQEDVLTWAAAL